MRASTASNRSSGSRCRTARSVVLLVALVSIGAYLTACGDERTEPVNTPPPAETNSDVVKFNFSDKDYSKFDHKSEQHERLPCLVCHTAERADRKVKFNGHIPCSSCHVEHFAQKEHSICTVCHTSSDGGPVKPFPQLASFGAKFDHAVHQAQAKCADCHSPTQRGAGFTVPGRSNAHATCFQCHASDAPVAKAILAKGSSIDSCSTCHQPGSPGPVERAARYVGNFSHSAHTRRMDCSACHSIRAGKDVTAPVPAMHFATARGQNCATCHNGKRAFGGEDFANCKRCHQGDSFKF